MFTTTCPRCQGGGEVITEPCESCRGAGFIERQRKVLVTFPPGIDSDQRLRVPGQGMPGPHGSACGDLYVDVGIEPDPRFERDGYNLIARQPISIVEAALGSTVSLLLPTNDSVSVEIKPGTQPETVITVKGRGVPRLDRRGRGDLLIAVEVQVPKKLSRQAKKLLLELEQELGSSGECSKASLG
jgi:molecular chaperone DnaJ